MAAASRFQTLCPHNLHMLFFFFFFSFISWAAESYASEDDPQYTNCSLPVTCGPPPTVNITYPFWGNGRADYCGVEGFKLGCQGDEYAFMDFEGQRYRVLEIDRERHVMTVARDDLWKDPCLKDQFLNTAMDNNTRFDYTMAVRNVSILYCPNGNPTSDLSTLGEIPCPLEGHPHRAALFVDEGVMSRFADRRELYNCNRIKVPVLQRDMDDPAPGPPNNWSEVLHRGFELAYRFETVCLGCESSGGICGANRSSPHNFICYCSDKPHPFACAHRGGKSSIAAKIGIAIAICGMLVFVLIFFYLGKKMRRVLFKGQKSDIDIENFIKQHGSLAPKRFSYSQVKRATNSFRRKLGQGGFGAVYSGKLPDGTPVAVKVLNASKGNGEEFINEVASISRTSHINIVTLLGFCYEGHKRALIYEFMSNGSLDMFLYDENALRNGTTSAWDKLYQIAVGIARGLEYLHRGCRTRILHFDIKPQNILLDDKLCPKISDFGMSKLCLERESIVSMLVARGTVGYIAPEVFSKNFGEVSHKSDVYSYGMMLLEMVGGRNKNLNEADGSSEVYFHDQVYQLIEHGYDQGLYNQLMEEDKQTARKMALVGVWCIQTDPKQRPSMGSVLEMLEGSIEALPTPPKPFLFSPPRSQIDPSSISASI